MVLRQHNVQRIKHHMLLNEKERAMDSGDQRSKKNYLKSNESHKYTHAFCIFYFIEEKMCFCPTFSRYGLYQTMHL